MDTAIVGLGLECRGGGRAGEVPMTTCHRLSRICGCRGTEVVISDPVS